MTLALIFLVLVLLFSLVARKAERAGVKLYARTLARLGQQAPEPVSTTE